MKKQMIALLVAGMMVGGAQAEGFAGTAGLMTDYAFRGVSQSDENVALTGSVEYGIGGLTVGAAATTVDKLIGSDRMELNAIMNYRTAITNDISVDVGAIYYAYPGSSNANTVEINSAANVSFGNLGTQLKVSFTDDSFGTNNKSWYSEVNGSYPAMFGTSLTAHIGYTNTDNTKSVTDYKLGLTKRFGKSVVGELAYVDTNATGTLVDNRWIATASYQF